MSNAITPVRRERDRDLEQDMLFHYPLHTVEDEQLPTARQMRYIMDTLTRLGGDLIQMRSEVDSLIEQNSILNETFKKLKAVIAEKGLLNIDDFDLACDVLSSYYDGGMASSAPTLKKYAV